MAITSTQLLDRVEKTLLDESNVEWSRAELLGYLNMMIRFVCHIKPDAYTVNEAVELTPLETKQPVPALGYHSFRAIRNMGIDGVTIGPAVTKVESNHLDRIDPDWHTRIGVPIEHYAFDPRDPAIFWVYPRPPDCWYIQLEYGATPTEITETPPNDSIPLKDVYEMPLFWGVIALAFMKNSKRGDMTKEQGYINLIAQVLGNKQKVQSFFDPLPGELDTIQDGS